MVKPSARKHGIIASDPRTMRVGGGRRDHHGPGKRAKIIEAKMMIDEVPGAVREHVEKSWNTREEAAARIGGERELHFSAKKSVDNAVKGKMEE